MVRKPLAAVLFAVSMCSSLAAAGPAALAAGTRKPEIVGTEVGYFGSSTVAHRVSVFVYSDLGPSAGNRVTVCLHGVCKAAKGHDGATAWYSASFNTHGMQMGERVRYTAIASDVAGRAELTTTSGLLCMHNNGSTPQT